MYGGSLSEENVDFKVKGARHSFSLNCSWEDIGEKVFSSTINSWRRAAKGKESEYVLNFGSSAGEWSLPMGAEYLLARSRCMALQQERGCSSSIFCSNEKMGLFP